MNWTRLPIRFGSGLQNALVLAKVHECFVTWSELHAGRGLADDVAMFSLHDPVTADVVVYFTPNAADFALRLPGIEASEPPARNKFFEFNGGDERAWDLIEAQQRSAA